MFERGSDYGDMDYDYYTEKPQDLRPLKKLDGWKIAEHTSDIRGMKVVDRDGKDIGEVEDLLMSMSAHEAIFTICSIDKSLNIDKKHILIPLDRLKLDKDNKRVVFDGVVDHIKDVPEYKSDIHDYTPFYDHWSRFRSTAGVGQGYETREFRHYVTYPEGLEEEEEEEVVREDTTRGHLG